MKTELLNILCCPLCKSEMLYSERQGLTCSKCMSVYPIYKNVYRFVDSDNYVDTFSYEWNKHKQSQLDSASGLNRAEEMFFERTGFTREELKGKLILDAGCGIGRFTEIVKKYGGNVVGVDLSYSVEAAKKNVFDAMIIQADIHNLPFKPESFDFVFSLGVIHHTSDTRKAFDCLARLVKPDGKMAVWVYSNEGLWFKIHNVIADFIRLFTTRLPRNMLYRLSYVSIPLYYIHMIPVVGIVTRMLLDTSMEKITEWRVFDTYDWYSPKYQTKHTYVEVVGWFYNCGFKHIKSLKVPVSVVGIK